MIRGWLVRPNAPARSLTSDGMIETGYEVPSFIVLEAKPNGWLRFYGRATDEVAWVHRCALGGVVFTPWTEWLVSPTIAPLSFRTRDNHTLRATPNGAAITIIERDTIWSRWKFEELGCG